MRQVDAGPPQLQEQMALHEQGTLFEITLAVLSAVADEERARIAHEIHDGVAQTMYALNLGIENCARLVLRGEHSRLNESLKNLVPLSRQTLLEIRHYIYDLTPLLSGGNSWTDLNCQAEH